MRFLDFHAQVLVDGANLTEYNIQYDKSANVATCWIPSEAGKSFTVILNTLRPLDYDLSIDLYADSNLIDGCIGRRGHKSCLTFNSKRTSATTVCPLFFVPLELTDDDSYLNSSGKDLGTITLKISRANISKHHHHYRHRPSDVVPENTHKVHERSKKIMQHRIGFGNEIHRVATKYYSTNCQSTICKFNFKYRSIDILRADSLAPRSVTKRKRKTMDSDSDEEDNGDGLQSKNLRGDNETDEARLKRLFEKIKSIESRMASRNGGQSISKKVKREERPVLVSGNREFIDLT